MKMPRRLKIGGHQVSVVFKDLSESPVAGEWNPKNNTITIDKTISVSQQEESLFHEILHVINGELDGEGYAHAFGESLAQQFYQVLSDNKMLR